MLTVKHIDSHGREEEYHQTVTCRYTQGTSASLDQTDTPDTLWIDSGPLTGGVCYVMNESGKTVGKYTLSGCVPGI